jgi:hypothetical protein
MEVNPSRAFNVSKTLSYDKEPLQILVKYRCKTDIEMSRRTQNIQKKRAVFQSRNLPSSKTLFRLFRRIATTDAL